MILIWVIDFINKLEYIILTLLVITSKDILSEFLIDIINWKTSHSSAGFKN